MDIYLTSAKPHHSGFIVEGYVEKDFIKKQFESAKFPANLSKYILKLEEEIEKFKE